MKRIFFLFLIIGNICHAQGWSGEIIVGVSGYNGDLTNKLIDIKTWHPAIGLNVRYSINDLIAVRFGLMQAKVSGNDQDNSAPDFKNRNLNFQSNISEGTLCGEFNLLSPETYSFYPYVFGGIGFFHFNPYSFDNNNYKTYLRPLSTEGEGLPEYPGRKNYSLTQFCIPFGVGVKKKINSDLDIGFELEFHKLFTDYLDDVSKSYIDYNILLKEKGPEAVQMAYRQLNQRIPHENYVRGSPKKNDTYYIVGLKLVYHFQD
jgi:Domain of unknown function (DUF6089)